VKPGGQKELKLDNLISIYIYIYLYYILDLTFFNSLKDSL
jgi:hypothetical protein